MLTVNGACNWKLKIRREEEEIHILRAQTCEEHAVLPDTLLDLPVTVLGDRALAAGARDLPGEEVRIVCGPEREEWNNRNIRTLTLPSRLKRMEAYALYNCSSLETLCFTDRIRDIGGDLFMNCRLLHRFEIRRVPGEQGPMLSYLARQFPRDLDVTVTEADGETCSFLLPEYWENIEENKAAHQFEFKLGGAGYPYHNDVFQQHQLDMHRYDELWTHYLELEHEDRTALRMAWKRLRTPKDLSGKASEQYGAYLRSQMRQALELAIREDDAEGLRMLLEWPEAQGDALTDARALARELHRTRAMALLLEKQPVRNEKRGLDKDFDL